MIGIGGWLGNRWDDLTGVADSAVDGVVHAGEWVGDHGSSILTTATGAAEVALGTGVGIVTGWTGVGTVAGGLIAMDGLDRMNAGVEGMFDNDRVRPTALDNLGYQVTGIQGTGPVVAASPALLAPVAAAVGRMGIVETGKLIVNSAAEMFIGLSPFPYKRPTLPTGRVPSGPAVPKPTNMKPAEVAPAAGGGGRVHIYIWGEGRHPSAVNLNRTPTTTTTGAPGRPIPNRVQYDGGRLPYGDRSVDIINLENAPIRPDTITEIARVVKPGGDIRLVGPATPRTLADHQRIADAVGGKVFQVTLPVNSDVGEMVYTNIIVPLK